MFFSIFFPILYNVIEIIIKRKPSSLKLYTNGWFVRKTVTLQRFARFDNHFISVTMWGVGIWGGWEGVWRKNTTRKISSRVASDNSITSPPPVIGRSIITLLSTNSFFFHLSEPIARVAHTSQWRQRQERRRQTFRCRRHTLRRLSLFEGEVGRGPAQNGRSSYRRTLQFTLSDRNISTAADATTAAATATDIFY